MKAKETSGISEKSISETINEIDLRRVLCDTPDSAHLEEIVKNAVLNTTNEIDQFRKNLTHNVHYKKLLARLDSKGCSEIWLSALLLQACKAAIGKPERLLDMGGFTTPQLKALNKSLVASSSLVKRVNQTTLSPKYDLLWAPQEKERESLRLQTARLYEMLPGIMMAYAVQLEQFLKFSRTVLRQLDVADYRALKVLRYIHAKTGRPQYEVVSDLLQGGFYILAPSKAECPPFFTEAALAKIYQRTGKLDKKTKSRSQSVL